MDEKNLRDFVSDLLAKKIPEIDLSVSTENNINNGMIAELFWLYFINSGLLNRFLFEFLKITTQLAPYHVNPIIVSTYPHRRDLLIEIDKKYINNLEFELPQVFVLNDDNQFAFATYFHRPYFIDLFDHPFGRRHRIADLLDTLKLDYDKNLIDQSFRDIYDSLKSDIITIIITEKPVIEPQFLYVSCNSINSTLGVSCKNDSGKDGVTAALHAINGNSVKIENGNYNVLSTDQLSDSVFIETPGKIFSGPNYKKVLSGQAPGQNQKVQFLTLRNKTSIGPTQTDAYVQGWNPSILANCAGLPVQQQIYTDACTVSGDSGTALIDDNDNLLGFLFGRTQITTQPNQCSYSVWTWAEQVFTAHDLK